MIGVVGETERNGSFDRLFKSLVVALFHVGNTGSNPVGDASEVGRYRKKRLATESAHALA